MKLKDKSQPSVSSALHREIAVTVKSMDFSFTIKHVAVQSQFEGIDCGVFAIAFATQLCMVVDPYMLKYKQTQMRAQLLRGLEKLVAVFLLPHFWENKPTKKGKFPVHS